MSTFSLRSSTQRMLRASQGQLATLDRKLATEVFAEGSAALALI